LRTQLVLALIHSITSFVTDGIPIQSDALPPDPPLGVPTGEGALSRPHPRKTQMRTAA
jgi:hypothetical protein